MINLIGILILIIIEAILINSYINKHKGKIENLEKEQQQLYKRIYDQNQIIKNKNIKIKELENEINETKKRNNSRLRKNH